MNSVVEELGCSQKKQIFHHLEIQATDLRSDLSFEEKEFSGSCSEIAEVLSNLHPVSESDANSWMEDGSLRWITHGSKIVAVAQVYFYPESAEINRIATHSNFLRKGFAKDLVSKIYEEMKNRKIKKLFLKVEDIRMPAISFYLNFGFKEIGDKRQIWHSKFF